MVHKEITKNLTQLKLVTTKLSIKIVKILLTKFVVIIFRIYLKIWVSNLSFCQILYKKVIF